MNMTLNTLAPAPAAPDAALPAAPSPAAAALPAAAAFAQWLDLGQQLDPAARQLDAAARPAPGIEPAADPDAAGADAAVASDQPSPALAPEGVQLAAMATPLMLPAAAAAFVRTVGDAPAQDPRAPGAAAEASAPRLHSAAAPVLAAAPAAELAPALAQPQATGQNRTVNGTPPAPVAQPAPGATAEASAARLHPAAALAPALAQSQAAGQNRTVNGTPSAPVAQPAPGAAGDGAAAPLSAAELRTGLDAAPMPVAATHSTAGGHGVPEQARAAAPFQAGAPGAADARLAAEARAITDDSAAPASDRAAANWSVGAPATAAARVAPDTVLLAGPPTAWRQALHEALGENLNLQLSKRSEQAVIRLDPPLFGRIEIAIRHSAGALDIKISATHSEVLRQLNAVSDNLRSDLAQRQFSEVAVTVMAAPRGAHAAPHGEPQQGRGRQPARDEQPQDPGRALADGSGAGSLFSLNAGA